MHKKQASLVPLTYQYTIGSEEDEAVATLPHDPSRACQQSPTSTVLARKTSARSRTPDSEAPCSCNATAVPSRSSSGALPLQSSYSLPFSAVIDSPNGNARAPRMVDTAFAVDGHKALVSLTAESITIAYTGGDTCCMPGVSTETILISEILSAQALPCVTSKWLWHPFAEKTYRFSLFTFQRSARSPTSWHPRSVTLSTPTERVALHWSATINAAAAAQRRRPRHLLVLINPFGGKRRGPQLYARVVAPVFEKAGIKTTVCTTQFGGHATDYLRDMPLTELAALDGIVAVGGDGLFHEIVNALLQMRDLNGSSARSQAVAKDNDNDQAQQRASAVSLIRVGHIPAGSTDAVACTLNGTRSAFSAAMRIALGDGVPLDVLRIDASNGSTHYAMSMASYGFMGDLMADSEKYRWMGPLRYELIGAKMLAANRSYGAKISYLPAERTSPGSFSRVCTSRCDMCIGRGGAGGHSFFRASRPSSPMADGGHGADGISHERPSSPVFQSQHVLNRPSYEHRREEWVTVDGEFAGIMLVIMPCRSDKSVNGVARYGHLSDGNIHLVMVRQCSRLQYLRFLLKLSSTGLEAGHHGGGGYIEVVPAVAVKVQPLGSAAQSVWNMDGELLRCPSIQAETLPGAIEVFSRGVESGSEWE